jgi:hypothetical protein
VIDLAPLSCFITWRSLVGHADLSRSVVAIVCLHRHGVSPMTDSLSDSDHVGTDGVIGVDTLSPPFARYAAAPLAFAVVHRLVSKAGLWPAKVRRLHASCVCNCPPFGARSVAHEQQFPVDVVSTSHGFDANLGL